MIEKVKIAIGLGSNLGDRSLVFQKAFRALCEDVIEEATSSSVYETAPMEIIDQPVFLNAVVSGMTEWKPPALINYLKLLEQELGRVPGLRFGPRLIDLDLLVYGNLSWENENVIVPHPRLSERAFVLIPLVEIWEDWRHPILNRTSRELLMDLRDSKISPQGARYYAPPLQDTESP